MKNYILTKTPKGKKFLYQVFDNENNLISKRESTRDYVACTSGGSFYFGRLDLIGKGDYAKLLHYYAIEKNFTFEQYLNSRSGYPDQYKTDIAYKSFLAKSELAYNNLSNIAYL